MQFGGGFTISLGNQTTIGISLNTIYEFANGFV
jgi:hypothetical protein